MNYEELERLVKDEIVQRAEEGCDVLEAKARTWRLRKEHNPPRNGWLGHRLQRCDHGFNTRSHLRLREIT